VNKEFDVIVVGAGAAGMMAAGRAAELGAKVLLLEKMDRPGKKILISGNGRCNLTNSQDMDTFITNFGANGRFLYSAFSRFFREELLTLMEQYGTLCRTGPTGKVYPVSDNASDVVRALTRYTEEGKVTVHYGVNVTGILKENGKVCGVETVEGTIPAPSVIVAAGGSSHPQTGSDGNGYKLAESLGHTIVKLRPGLVPLVVTDIEKAKQMQGASLRNVRVTAFQCPADKIDSALIPTADTGPRLPGKRPRPPVIESRTGDVIITHFGFSGPAMLEMSLAIVDALENGPVSVSIDLYPDKDKAALRADLQQAFDRLSSNVCQHVIRRFVTKKLVDPFVIMSSIPPDKLSNQITAEEREKLVDLMKSLRFDIKAPYNMDAAMVTAGGVFLKEVDPRTMESKLVEGLYFCGEVLDLDAGTGGFNLQAAFSTGYIAGESAAAATAKAADPITKR
jgi:predicted flavoprotein YhiN